MQSNLIALYFIGEISINCTKNNNKSSQIKLSYTIDKTVFWWFSYSTVLQVGVRQGRGASRISPSVDSRGIVKKWFTSMSRIISLTLKCCFLFSFFWKKKAEALTHFLTELYPLDLENSNYLHCVYYFCIS